ncbi:MAG: hypothetical protein JWN14_3989 [Chthonomonadales bacterium]|nr:hypothetical protein [Chthonomonadales bacterium]
MGLPARVRPAIVLLCCLICMGFVIARLLSSKTSLWQRSTQITAYNEDMQGFSSDNEVVLYHANAVPFPLIEHRNLHGGDAHAFSVPFRDLNQKFSGDEVSPDGKWIKWFSYDHISNGHEHLVTYNVETHRMIVWPSVWGGEGACTFWWMPDSRHWLEYIQERPGYRLYDVENPKDIQKFTLKADFLNTKTDELAPRSKQLIFYPSNIEAYQKPVRKGMDIVSCALADHAEPQRLHPVIDVDGEITEFAFSPDGDHIAWLIDQFPHSAPIQFLQRFLPTMITQLQPSQSIWITRLDGSNPHELGRIPMQSRESSEIGNLHWLPDGKQVSFGSRNFIYVTRCSDAL